MNRDAEDDLQEEYDFSKGIRGKYARRYREGVRVREFPGKNAVATADASQWISQALATSQRLEYTIALCLTASARQQPREAVASLRDVLHHSSPARWASLLSGVPHFVEQGRSLPQRLHEFALEKEWFVHSCLVSFVTAEEPTWERLTPTLERVEQFFNLTSGLWEAMGPLADQTLADSLTAADRESLRAAISKALESDPVVEG